MDDIKKNKKKKQHHSFTPFQNMKFKWRFDQWKTCINKSVGMIPKDLEKIVRVKWKLETI